MLKTSRSQFKSDRVITHTIRDAVLPTDSHCSHLGVGAEFIVEVASQLQIFRFSREVLGCLMMVANAIFFLSSAARESHLPLRRGDSEMGIPGQSESGRG